MSARDARVTRICVAEIGAAHGVRGEVRLRILGEGPQAVARYGPFESEDGTRRFEIVSMRPAKDHFVARLKGVADRNAAEALRLTRLYVPRERLAAPNEDEFYHADLVGLAVVLADGTALGHVMAVRNFGAGDLLEIARPGADSVFAPFTKAAVPEIDIAAGRLVLDPPEGLLDASSDEPEGDRG